jgi:hypothetical protein
MRRHHLSRLNFHAMNRSGSSALRSVAKFPVIISTVRAGLRIRGISQHAMRVLLQLR